MAKSSSKKHPRTDSFCPGDYFYISLFVCYAQIYIRKAMLEYINANRTLCYSFIRNNLATGG